jgi:hypothetical protein
MAKRLVLAMALLALGACDEAMMTAAPSGPDTSGLPDPAVATCMSAVARQTGNGVVAAQKITHGIVDETVIVGVGEARAPWECRVDRSGAVTGLTALAGEGAL